MAFVTKFRINNYGMHNFEILDFKEYSSWRTIHHQYIINMLHNEYYNKEFIGLRNTGVVYNARLKY